ncbi:MAG: substrate-binding domain-containing protein [Candidatus Rariloculaceae bacterium]
MSVSPRRGARSVLTGPLLITVAVTAGYLSISDRASAQGARDYVSIVGSSTVYPFATVVAEYFGRASQFKTPKIESTGSGGGFKLFCAGVGVQHPDVTNSSRRVKASEIEGCAANGVTEIIEVKIGYDGIVLANSRTSTQFSLTREQVFLALAKEVPDPSGAAQLVANPYMQWSDIDASLPEVGIEVLGPPPTSGTRDAFVELVMDHGCAAFELIATLRPNDVQAACHTIREDGIFIEAGENDNLIVQKLEVNPDALGIFGYSFLDQNYDKVHGSIIDGQGPDFEAIADGSYPISRPLFFYVKKAHIGVIPGIEEFLREFTSDAAWGEFGYLSDRGLIPLPDAERSQVLAAVEGRENVDLAAN